MTKNPEAAQANQLQNQGQDKKDLSKAEQMNLLFKDLNDPAKQSDKDDIVSKMLSLILGDKKNESGRVDADGNPLKTRKEGDKGIDSDDKMMMMAFAFILIALTGGAAGAAIIGAAPAIGVVPDLMKMGKDFLGKSDKDLDEKESISIGKSSLAFLLANKVKDNILGLGDSFLNGDDNIVKSIGKYIESLRGMDKEEKTREIDSLKTMVKGSVALLEGKGVDKSDEKTGLNPSESDKKFNAIFAEFEAMISIPKEVEDPKNLISSLREIRVGDAIVSMESTTITKKNNEKVDAVEVKGDKESRARDPGVDVPSTASSVRKDGGGGPRAESAFLPGRAATAPTATGGR
jgi:hypothetical protein